MDGADNVGVAAEEGAAMEEEEAAGDSSSVSSEASIMSESELLEQAAAMEAAVAETPYDYESHVKLVSALRQLGELDRVRRARERMSDLFPLSEALWTEWLGDEIPLATMPGCALHMKGLFEKAVQDYVSLPIWLEYCKFAVSTESQFSEGVAFPRGIFERAIVACGLHVGQGSYLWSSYRDFEEARLATLQSEQQASPQDDSLVTQVEVQYERVEKLFKRQLTLPLMRMEDAFVDYQKFAEEVVEEADLPAYQRAKQRLGEYVALEKPLLTETPPPLECYRDYIARAQSLGEGSTFLNLLYQRCIADHPLNVGLWKEYLAFLYKNFRLVGSVLLFGHSQAVRNCPWMVEFWVSYAQAMERSGTDHNEIVDVFEKGLGSESGSAGNFTKSKDYLQLWTAYCDYLRRRVGSEGVGGEGDVEGEVAASLVELRKTFKRARDELEAYYGKDGDPSDSLSCYQARLEASCYGNIMKARELFDDVMSRHGREVVFWLQYADIERYCGSLLSCRKLLQRAVNSASDSPYGICQALLQFEREVGTLETYEQALERTSAQMKRVQGRNEKAAEKESVKKEERKKQRKPGKTEGDGDAGKGGRRGRGERKGDGEGGPVGRKRTQGAHVFFEGDEGATRPAKKPRVAQAAKSGSAATPTPPDKESPIRREEASSTVPDGDAKTEGGVRGSDRGYPGETERKRGRTREEERGERRELAAEEGPGEEEMEVVEGEGPKEARTAFVSNLTFTIDEEQIREKFSECGRIADLRLIKTRKAGKGNVYAYVEFLSPASLPAALALDRSLLNERPLFVSPCREKGKPQPAPRPKFTAANEKATVFVSNIQFNTTEAELEQLFGECGEIKEVRLVRNRSGRSKGFAYIEYKEEASSGVAVLKLNDHRLGLKKLKVAISNPPKRLEGESEWESAFTPHQTGSDLGDNPLARKSKTHVSLIPRAVARREERGKEGESGSKGKLSNEDFRKLLYKK